jgi:hypothetical protein
VNAGDNQSAMNAVANILLSHVKSLKYAFAMASGGMMLLRV